MENLPWCKRARVEASDNCGEIACVTAKVNLNKCCFSKAADRFDTETVTAVLCDTQTLNATDKREYLYSKLLACEYKTPRLIKKHFVFGVLACSTCFCNLYGFPRSTYNAALKDVRSGALSAPRKNAGVFMEGARASV